MNIQCACNNNANKLSNIKDELTEIFASGETNTFDNKVVLINQRTYKTNLLILEVDTLFQIARSKWRQVEECILRDKVIRNLNISEYRKEISSILSVCRCIVKGASKGSQKDFMVNKLRKHLEVFANCITRWVELSDATLIKLTADSVKNPTFPIHDYFHMYLDVHWLILSLSYLFGGGLKEVTELMKDLTAFSCVLFKDRPDRALKENELFCACFKRSWLLLQLFIEKLSALNVMGKSFWAVFNEILEKSEETFSLWLVNRVGFLHKYNEEGEYYSCGLTKRVCENYGFLEDKLKMFNLNCNNVNVRNGHLNGTLLNFCQFIQPLMKELWIENVRSEPYQIMWEIYNKHINTFNTPNKTSAVEIIETLDTILGNNIEGDSYKYFLSMLNEHLTKYPDRWPRMRGRIYCKLPQTKINEFNDVGLFNVSLLFLSLSTSVNMKEMLEKLLSVLSNLTVERRSTPLVINIYVSLVILHVRQGYSVKNCLIPLLEIINTVSCNLETFYLIRLYIDGVEAVLNVSDDFGLDQHRLIDKWAVKYLIKCQLCDLCYFLNVLLCNIKRIRNGGAWNEWEPVLKDHILPALKTIATTSTAALQVGELAATIQGNPSSDLVLTFTSDMIAPKVASQYLTTLLENVPENYSIPKQFETAIFQSWIRCSLLNTEGSEKLTKNVMKIRTLHLQYNNKLTAYDEKPFISFIVSFGHINNSKSLSARELCEACFGGVDSWMSTYLVNPANEVEVIHIYTCIALLFYHASILLYNKSRSTCLFNRLISVLLLSTEVLKGNSPPHRSVVNAVQRTWHCFVQGIFKLELDAYLQRTLKDLIVSYLPLLPIKESPILKCLQNEQLAVLIFEKISLHFLTNTLRTTNVNTQKALKLIKLALEQSDNPKVVLRVSLTSIFEVIMFNVDKGLAMDVVKFLSSCEKYQEYQIVIEDSLVWITTKHLAFNTNSYFQFFNNMAKIIADDVRKVLPNIKKRVTEVERMRGVGFDNTLRQGLNALERLLV